MGKLNETTLRLFMHKANMTKSFNPVIGLSERRVSSEQDNAAPNKDKLIRGDFSSRLI